MIPLNHAASVSQAVGAVRDQAAAEGWVLCSSNSNSSHSISSHSISSSNAEQQMPLFVVLDDTWQGTPKLSELFDALQRPCFGLLMPEVCKNARLACLDVKLTVSPVRSQCAEALQLRISTLALMLARTPCSILYSMSHSDSIQRCFGLT